MEIGRRIYYDNATGSVILDKGERSGNVVVTTVEQDFENYVALAERVPVTVGVLELENSQYAEDFLMCNGYRVDPDTEEILFSYPDPEVPEQPPVYRKPLSEQVAEQDQRLADIELALADIFTGGGE